MFLKKQKMKMKSKSNSLIGYEVFVTHLGILFKSLYALQKNKEKINTKDIMIPIKLSSTLCEY